MQDNPRENFTADLIKQNDKYAAKLNEKLNRELIESLTQKRSNNENKN